MLRSSAASSSSSPASVSNVGSAVSASVSMRVMAWSSWSYVVGLVMGPLLLRLFRDSRPQRLEGAELQLLHRAFDPPELPRDLADAALVHETPDDDLPLVVGKGIDELCQQCAPLDRLAAAHGLELRFRFFRQWMLSRRPLSPVGDGMRG